jgi:hypothetical protein
MLMFRQTRSQVNRSTSHLTGAGYGIAPGWWFNSFEPLWGPFIQRLSGQNKVSVTEFERAASQVRGLTRMEKAIMLSVFHHQQELA